MTDAIHAEHWKPKANPRLIAATVEGVAKEGKCVIICHNSECVLRQPPHVLHVLVFAPVEQKVARMKIRHPREHDISGLLRGIGSERTHYTQHYYGLDWSDRRLCTFVSTARWESMHAPTYRSGDPLAIHEGKRDLSIIQSDPPPTRIECASSNRRT